MRRHNAPTGEVAERLNAPVLKTGNPLRGSGVRISPSPPESNVYFHARAVVCYMRRLKLYWTFAVAMD